MLLYFIGNTNLQLIERNAAVKLIHKVLPRPNSDTLSTYSLGYLQMFGFVLYGRTCVMNIAKTYHLLRICISFPRQWTAAV